MEKTEVNREDIIRMAQEASSGNDDRNIFFDLIIEELEAFADLVASAEREACAKVCEEEYDTGLMMAPVAPNLAAKIRARGQA